jgi:hypothetical protein
MFLSRSSRERKESCIKRDGVGRSRPSAVRAAWIHTETWARLLTVACFGGRALGGSEAGYCAHVDCKTRFPESALSELTTPRALRAGGAFALTAIPTSDVPFSFTCTVSGSIRKKHP